MKEIKKKKKKTTKRRKRKQNECTAVDPSAAWCYMNRATEYTKVEIAREIRCTAWNSVVAGWVFVGNEAVVASQLHSFSNHWSLFLSRYENKHWPCAFVHRATCIQQCTRHGISSVLTIHLEVWTEKRKTISPENDGSILAKWVIIIMEKLLFQEKWIVFLSSTSY